MRSVEAVRAELEDQYGDIFKFASRVVERNRAQANRWRDKENEAVPVLYHFAKSVNLLDATSRLCHDGFAREAIATSRSLFNLFINLRWLTKPGVSSKRLEKFTDHEMTSKANKCDDAHQVGKKPYRRAEATASHPDSEGSSGCQVPWNR